MLVAIHAHGVGLSANSRATVIDQVQLALSSAARHVRRVAVYLSDENGPRGGVDKKCLVRVDFGTGQPVTAEARGGSVLGVVDAATGRAAKAVRTALHKRFDVRKRTRKLVKLFRGLFRRRTD